MTRISPGRIMLVLGTSLTILLIALAVKAGAQTQLVTDYDNYPDTPQAELPPGCDGGGLYHSETFSLNGGPAVSNPASLPAFNAGDELTMLWTDVTDECVGAPIVLTIKIAPEPTFDPDVDQAVYVPYALVIATAGPGSVTYVLPDLAPFGLGCNYQMDAIVGIPLAVVGPSGSDYSASVRGDDKRTTLIAWRNGAYPACEAPVTSTTAPVTTTTEAPVTTTVADVTTTAPEAPTTTAPVAISEVAQNVTPPVQTVPVAASLTARQLATTGRGGILAMTAAGSAILAAGLVLVLRKEEMGEE